MAFTSTAIQERNTQLALRPHLAGNYPKEVTWLQAENDAIAMRLRLALQPEKFTLTEDQAEFQRFIQIQIPSFFGKEANCTALRALRVSLIFRASLSSTDIRQHIDQLFLYLDLYMALGDKKNFILIQEILQKRLAHCHDFPELDWIRFAFFNPELTPLLLQPRTFNPIAQKDLGDLPSPYQPLEFLKEMRFVVYHHLIFCKMHFDNAFSSNQALVDLVLKFEYALPRLISRVSSLREKLDAVCAICDRCRCHSPKAFFEERRKLFVEIEQIMADLRAQFHELSEIHEAFKNCDQEGLSHEEKLTQMYCIEMLQIAFTMFFDFSEAMNTVMANQKMETDAYEKELEHVHQVISVPYTYRGISYFHIFFVEFFSALSSLDGDQQALLFQSMAMSFVWMLRGITATACADFSHACATYKSLAEGLQVGLQQQFQGQETERLKKLIEVLVPLLSNRRLHFFLQPVGNERERGENDRAFIAALLKIASFLPKHLYHLAMRIQIKPALKEDPTLLEFDAIQKDLAERLLVISHCIENSADDKQALMHLADFMDRCALSLDRLDILVFDQSLLQQCGLDPAEILLFIDNLKFFTLLLKPATTYGIELSLLSESEDSVPTPQPYSFVFTADHEAAAAPDEEKQEPLAILMGQLQQKPELPGYITRHYLVILHEMLHGPIFLWQPALVAEEALSKCALLLEQILKALTKEEGSSEHDLVTLLAKAHIPFTEDEEQLLKQLDSLNVNLTYEMKKCPLLIELDRYMQMLDRLHRKAPYLSDEKFLQGKFGEQQEHWIQCGEDLIAQKINEVKGLIEKTLSFAIKLTASFGSAKIEVVPLSQTSPRPNAEHLARFQGHVEKLQEALKQLIRKNATEAGKKISPIAEESKRDIKDRISLKAKYIEKLHDTLDHLKRALIFPSTHCERTYKTILATIIAQTLELAELIALINQPMSDPKTGCHILFSTVRAKKFLHSHELKQFYELLKAPLKLTQTGPIRLFENHLKMGARYPTLKSELFLESTDELLRKGFQVMEIALALLQ